MVGCSVVNCSNRSSRKKEPATKSRISFHRFPHDPQIYNAWVKAVRRENWTPSKASVICSEHFTNDCLDSSDFKRILLKHAIPTIFPDIYHKSVLDQREELPICEVSNPLHSSESMNVDTVVAPGTLNISSNKEATLPNKKSVRRTTSFPPKRRRHRALSPSTQQQTNKYKYKQNFYTKKIKLLQQQSRRHVKRIATLKNVLTELKKKILTMKKHPTAFQI